MVFRILDASAFYSGVPFNSGDDCYTTSQVYEEVKHIKKNHDALGALLEANRLKIMDPKIESVQAAIMYAKKTGDFQQLSKEDISLIALAIDTAGQIITDDFALINVTKHIGLNTSSTMTEGIKDEGMWVHYCPGCHKNQLHGKECTICGTLLKRKLLKRKSSLSIPNK